MGKVITIKQASEVSKQLSKKGKKIVLAGGCFDLLHAGHIQFLTEAKKRGDVLFVLLESDENIRRYKGKNRPINNQKDRGIILSSLVPIDYVVMLPELPDDKSYDEVILRLQPAIIATTIGDPKRVHKERQSKLAKGKVVDVISRISDASTSRLASLLRKEI